MWWFFPGPIRKYIRNKGNGVERGEDFWQDKFSAGKFWWFFGKKTSGKIWWVFLVMKFVHGNFRGRNPPPDTEEGKILSLNLKMGVKCPLGVWKV